MSTYRSEERLTAEALRQARNAFQLLKALEPDKRKQAIEVLRELLFDIEHSK